MLYRAKLWLVVWSALALPVAVWPITSRSESISKQKFWYRSDLTKKDGLAVESYNLWNKDEVELSIMCSQREDGWYHSVSVMFPNFIAPEQKAVLRILADSTVYPPQNVNFYGKIFFIRDLRGLGSFIERGGIITLVLELQDRSVKVSTFYMDAESETNQVQNLSQLSIWNKACLSKAIP